MPKKKSTTSKSESETKKKSVKKDAKDKKKINHDDESFDNEVNTEKHGDFVVKKIDPSVDDEDVNDDVNNDEDDMSEKSNNREELIADQLAEIYENSDGSMPDMKNFESRKRNRFIRALVTFLFSCLIFAGAAWAGLFVIQPRIQFSQSDVVVSISGDDIVTPGSEVVYRVRYRNAQSVTLENAILEVRYPQGFVFVSSTVPADNERGDKWTLGTLDPGGGGYIDITGTFFGSIGAEYSLRTFLSYSPSNFTSTFQAIATKSIVVGGDVVSLDIVMGDEVSRGLQTPIMISLTPTNDNILEHVTVECSGSGFTPSERSTPDRNKDTDCSWDFERIAGTTIIDFSGQFDHYEQMGNFAIVVKGWDTASRTGDGYVLAEEKKIFTLVDTVTNLHVVVNGSTSEALIAPGETISANMVVKNNGDTTLTNAEVVMVIDAPSYTNRSILDWAQLTVTEDARVLGSQLSPEVRRGTITWDKSHIPALGSIAPGEEVVIDMAIPVRTGNQVTLANFTSNDITVSASFTHGSDDERTSVSSNMISLTLVSDFDLEVSYDIDRVGDKDEYVITWLISNSFHALQDIRLEADLYGTISFDVDAVNTSAGSVTYDESSKRLVWIIPEMPTSLDVNTLRFTVSHTPNPTQTNLTSRVRMSAEDEVTGVRISKEGSEIVLQ